MNADRLRTLSAALGAGSVAFGVAPVVAPRFFGRLFGLGGTDRPDVVSIYRSVGARDIAVGAGLYWAATRGQPLAPWLAARVICDGVDAAATGLAIVQGARHPRFLALALAASGATAGGAFLLTRSLRTRG